MLEGKWGGGGGDQFYIRAVVTKLYLDWAMGKILLDMSFHRDSTLLDTKKLSLKYSDG